MSIILIGLPGSGKSSVGKALSALLRWEFVDLDEEVQRRAGTSIAQIFARGEDCFREVEANCLREWLSRGDCVIATGGGVVETPCNRRDLMEATGRGSAVVFLDVEVPEALRRIDGTAHRPLLSGGAEQNLRSIARRRTQWYRQCANLHLKVDDRPAHVHAQRLCARLVAEADFEPRDNTGGAH
ncbi:shikimate kinase [Gleimia hominis]|uniref:Shikimate kinase n=1 Tax=Gleimia hominis TaxID=595468 RepID=A0ABU3IDW6_9ACTO|nr:shikimate kinase [Gleimia hominis]MDT3767677.1 shikimate kinase [Gleimia hominis]